MMSWIKEIFVFIGGLLLFIVPGTFIRTFIFGEPIVRLLLMLIIPIILTVFIVQNIFKSEKIEKPDESLLILHMTDKCNTADVTFSDLVNCLEEKGFSISEYSAIRRVSFDKTKKASVEYHSIFKKVEKLMQEEIKK